MYSTGGGSGTAVGAQAEAAARPAQRRGQGVPKTRSKSFSIPPSSPASPEDVVRELAGEVAVRRYLFLNRRSDHALKQSAQYRCVLRLVKLRLHLRHCTTVLPNGVERMPRAGSAAGGDGAASTSSARRPVSALTTMVCVRLIA